MHQLQKIHDIVGRVKNVVSGGGDIFVNLPIHENVWYFLFMTFPESGSLMIVKYVRNIKYKSAYYIHPQKSKEKVYLQQVFNLTLY